MRFYANDLEQATIVINCDAGVYMWNVGAVIAITLVLGSARTGDVQVSAKAAGETTTARRKGSIDGYTHSGRIAP